MDKLTHQVVCDRAGYVSPQPGQLIVGYEIREPIAGCTFDLKPEVRPAPSRHCGARHDERVALHALMRRRMSRRQPHTVRLYRRPSR